jgi:hypothetical protein
MNNQHTITVVGIHGCWTLATSEQGKEGWSLLLQGRALTDKAYFCALRLPYMVAAQEEVGQAKSRGMM